MDIDFSSDQSIPVDSVTSLNRISDRFHEFHDQGAADLDHDMEVRTPSPSILNQWSPASSMTPPSIQFDDPGRVVHRFTPNAITPVDAQLYLPSTSGFLSIPRITEAPFIKTEQHQDVGNIPPFRSPFTLSPDPGTTHLSRFLPEGTAPGPHSREQHQEQGLPLTPAYPSRGYPMYSNGSPFIAEEAVYPVWREDQSQSIDDSQVISMRAKEKIAKSMALRARHRYSATNTSSSVSGSTSQQITARRNKSSMPYPLAGTSSQRGLVHVNSQSTIESNRRPPTEGMVSESESGHEFTTLRGSQKAEASGVFVNTCAPLNVRVYHGVSSRQPPNDDNCAVDSEAHATHDSSSTVTPGFSDHSEYEIYYKYLSLKQRGTPLWEPGPHLGLPTEYRENGVSNGDVGILKSTGAFIFLFNLFLSADHEINRGRVPDGFIPLDRSRAERNMEKNIIRDRCLTSSSLKRTTWFCSDFAFKTTESEGAVLVMPDGGLSEDLQNYTLINNHIATYIERWWEYVESEDRGVPTDGVIQVVIGTDKVSSWGMATFENEAKPMDFEFNGDRAALQWKRINGRAGPTEEEVRGLLTGTTASPLRNQCVFVRTLNFSIPGKFRDKLAVEVCASCSRKYQQVTHPSKLLNHRLLQKHPNAKVVATSDFDWMSVITENDTTMPSVEDICARVLSSHIICEQEGVVTLKKQQKDVSAGATADAMTRLSGTVGNDDRIDKYNSRACFDNLDQSDGDNRDESGPATLLSSTITAVGQGPKSLTTSPGFSSPHLAEALIGDISLTPDKPCIKAIVGSAFVLKASSKRRSHPGIHVCQYCQATFTRSHNLQYHIDSHLGIKRFASLCGKKFGAPSGVKRHQRHCRECMDKEVEKSERAPAAYI